MDLQVLLFVLDGAGTEDRNPLHDLRVLMKELKAYNESLMLRPCLVFANKSDLDGIST